MHFDMKTKSLAMADLEVTLLMHLRPFHLLLPPLPRRKEPFTALEGVPFRVPFHGTTAASCLEGALKITSGSGHEPGRQSCILT